MIAPSTPPTTPPAIAPVWLLPPPLLPLPPPLLLPGAGAVPCTRTLLVNVTPFVTITVETGIVIISPDVDGVLMGVVVCKGDDDLILGLVGEDTGMELVGEDVDELKGLGDTLLELELGGVGVGGMGCILVVLEEVGEGEETSSLVEDEVSIEVDGDEDEDEDEGDEEGGELDGTLMWSDVVVAMVRAAPDIEASGFIPFVDPSR